MLRREEPEEIFVSLPNNRNIKCWDESQPFLFSLPNNRYVECWGGGESNEILVSLSNNRYIKCWGEAWNLFVFLFPTTDTLNFGEGEKMENCFYFSSQQQVHKMLGRVRI